jgi:chorismate dehydratase
LDQTSAIAGLTVGKISYVNALPFYYGLLEDQDHVDFREGSPADVNRWMREGKVDIAPISSLEYALRPDDYFLLPHVCIGSRDFSRSVLLLSRERIEGLDHEPIVLTDKSLSSQVLLKILLKFKYRMTNTFHQAAGGPEELMSRVKACLVIGDEALYFRPKEFMYRYDLSELWWGWTGLPFCFALWAVRRTCYEVSRESVYQFHRRLTRALCRNTEDFERLIRDALGFTIADEQFAALFGYLFNLVYAIDVEMKESLLRFYDYAHQLGVIPSAPELVFLEGVPRF